MSLQIECFLNLCTSLIDSSLGWLSSPEQQRNSWSSEKSFPDFDIIMESFAIGVKDIFSTDEYKHFANEPVFLLLNRLYSKVNEYYYTTENIMKSMHKEVLLSDPKWNEIQKMAKETVEALNAFIKRNKDKDE